MFVLNCIISTCSCFEVILVVELNISKLLYRDILPLANIILIPKAPGFRSLIVFIYHHVSIFQIYQYEDSAYDNLCHPEGNTTSSCDANTPSISDHKNYLYLFIFTSLLFAIGSQPLYILGVTYLDDSLSRNSSPVYLGLWNSYSGEKFSMHLTKHTNKLQLRYFSSNCKVMFLSYSQKNNKWRRLNASSYARQSIG